MRPVLFWPYFPVSGWVSQTETLGFSTAPRLRAHAELFTKGDPILAIHSTP
jgi:hypothetical protein